ncbi:unnamed protein product, partial [Mesorhabditis belari]|uniref:HMG box domain-containing protein n=1 Tax=Mesorhabditis belari TaxID=2138241 RepID=A0AAF3F902_9BILA
MAEKIRVIQMKLAHRRDFFDLDDDLPEIVEMINCVANGRAVDDQSKWCKSSKECVDDALKKDPDTPKRSMSAFFWWLAENRARIKKDGMGVAEVGKVAGKEWGVLKDKSKWEKLADKDRQRYESDMAVYKKFSSIQNVHTI